MSESSRRTAKPSMWHSAALRHSPRPASPPTQQRRPANYLPPSLSIKPLARSMDTPDRKSTRLNSSHLGISYAVFCLKKNHFDASLSPGTVLIPDMDARHRPSVPP